MTEHEENDELDIPKEESFANLIDSYCAGMKDDIQVGDKVQGKIISIGPDTVFVDTGAKIDGVVEKQELLDENGQLMYQEGDDVELYVTSFAENEIRLSKALSGAAGTEMLRDAFEKEIPVEGKVKGPCKGGFNVIISNKRAFCPVSQIDLNYSGSPDPYIGGTYRFIIIRFEQGGKNIVVSRRQLLEKELEKEKQSFIEQLQVGSVVEGRVSNVVPYGVFVEIFPGLDGLVHVSELSWGRIEKPESFIRAGARVNVKVLSIQKEKPEQLKLSLSIKQAGSDPWTTISEEISAGDKIKGKVLRCAPFGAFVEIKPGIEGLLHISEMSYTRRILKPEDVVSPGETIDVVVKELSPEKRKISLSLKDVSGDPWEKVTETYRHGQALEGILERKEKFGYFITLEPGVTGLVPASKIRAMANAALIEKYKPGDMVPVIIERIDADERKISLSPVDTESEQEWKTFSADSEKTLGTLGEQLKQALESQKK